MNTAYDDDELEVESKPVALITATMKAELDHEVTTARAYPRSLKRFMNNCMDMVTLNEEVAESCIYALPRGGKTIEGPSARFAEILQNAWGNCRAGAQVIDEGEEMVTAEGVFYDLEANSKITMRVQRRITDKDGRRYNTDMIAMTGNAAASIAHRNAVLKGVPKAYWNPMYQAARQTVVGDIKSLANKRAEALEWLQKRHVSAEMVLATLGLEGIEDIGLDELGVLRGAIAAVKNGEATLEQAFAPKEGTVKPSAKPKTTAPKSKSKAKKEDAAAPASTAGAGASSELPLNDPDALVTSDQAADLIGLADKHGIPLNAICAKYEIGEIGQLPARFLDAAKKWIINVNAPAA